MGELSRKFRKFHKSDSLNLNPLKTNIIYCTYKENKFKVSERFVDLSKTFDILICHIIKLCPSL